jgi:hypothetical protein
MGDISDKPMGAYVAAGTFPYPLKAPRAGGSVDWQASFRAALQTPEAVDLIKSLNDNRALIIQLLSAGVLDTMSIINAVDAYLPALFHLISSLNRQDPVRLSAPTVFEWKGEFSSGATSKFQEMVYDVVMMLHLKATMHYTHANSLLESDYVSNLPQAGQHYLSAASAMLYLAGDLLPKWVTKSNQTQKPPENDAQVCMGLALYYQAKAQSCAALKASLKDGGSGTPPLVLSKLCMAVASLCRDSVSNFQSASVQVEVEFVIYISYLRELFMSMSYYYHASAQMSKEESGIALALFAKARNMLREQKPANGKRFDPAYIGAGIPSAMTTKVKAEVKNMIELIRDSESKADKDNRMVYFKSIPADADLPPAPEGALVMQAKPYVPPSSDVVVMFSAPSMTATGLAAPSDDGKLASTSGDAVGAGVEVKAASTDSYAYNEGGAGAAAVPYGNASAPTLPPPYEAPPPYEDHSKYDSSSVTKIDRTDSDLARELQEKLNGGEDL